MNARIPAWAPDEPEFVLGSSEVECRHSRSDLVRVHHARMPHSTCGGGGGDRRELRSARRSREQREEKKRKKEPRKGPRPQEGY